MMIKIGLNISSGKLATAEVLAELILLQDNSTLSCAKAAWVEWWRSAGRIRKREQLMAKISARVQAAVDSNCYAI